MNIKLPCRSERALDFRIFVLKFHIKKVHHDNTLSQKDFSSESLIRGEFIPFRFLIAVVSRSPQFCGERFSVSDGSL